MSRESLVFLLGVLIFIMPIIGVPTDWKEYALITIGILLIIIGFSLRRSAYYRRIDRGNGEFATDSFVESLPERGRESENLLGEDNSIVGHQSDILEHTPEEAELDK